MLRITRTRSDSTVGVTLEGKLLGPWLTEARAVIDRLAAGADDPARVELDLARVSYADAAAARWLAALRDRGVRLARPSPFLRQLLSTLSKESH